MRDRFSDLIEAGRDRVTGPYRTEPGSTYGRFRVRCPLTSTLLTLLVSDGKEWAALRLPGPPWEHVSVSTPTRCPTWEEMVWVKDQSVTAKVNIHPYTLHLWRPLGVEVPVPPAVCV